MSLNKLRFITQGEKAEFYLPVFLDRLTLTKFILSYPVIGCMFVYFLALIVFSSTFI